MQFSARAAGGGKTWSAARGCGGRGHSWGAFCGGAEGGARALVCRSRGEKYIFFLVYYSFLKVRTEKKTETKKDEKFHEMIKIK